MHLPGKTWIQQLHKNAIHIAFRVYAFIQHIKIANAICSKLVDRTQSQSCGPLLAKNWSSLVQSDPGVLVMIWLIKTDTYKIWMKFIPRHNKMDQFSMYLCLSKIPAMESRCYICKALLQRLELSSTIDREEILRSKSFTPGLYELNFDNSIAVINEAIVGAHKGHRIAIAIS